MSSGSACLKAAYPACWRIFQIGQRVAQRTDWVAGADGVRLWLQAAALALTGSAGSFVWWLPASAMLGIGTAMDLPQTSSTAARSSRPPAMRSGYGADAR